MSEKLTQQNVADATLEYSCLFGANKNVYRIAPSLQDGLYCEGPVCGDTNDKPY